MGGRNPSEALDNFRHFFCESLSCITTAYLHPIQRSDKRYILTYEPPADLLCEGGDRTLSIIQTFSVGPDRKRGGYKVSTHHYNYSLNERDEDGNVTEILAYHWHPDEFEVREPHLHVGCVPRVHFPTSRISIERFICMLIDYYQIEPILAEDKWKGILKKNCQAFDAMAPWK